MPNTPDPWLFGWTQLLTLIGFVVTICIAIGGFRTFNRWKREKIEEKRIDMALEVLSIAYEAKYVFSGIRSPMSYPAEWADMPKEIGNEEVRNRVGPFFAILKRIEHNKEFFDRVWKAQPKFMAMFGRDAEEVFVNLHKARRSIEVSAGMLIGMRRDVERDAALTQRMEADIWDVHLKPEDDKVGPQIAAFVRGIEDKCLPVVQGRLERSRRTKWISKVWALRGRLRFTNGKDKQEIAKT